MDDHCPLSHKAVTVVVWERQCLLGSPGWLRAWVTSGGPTMVAIVKSMPVPTQVPAQAGMPAETLPQFRCQPGPMEPSAEAPGGWGRALTAKWGPG